jgi:hypothetical protein
VAELVSMKIDPKEREKKYAESAIVDRPAYPYGLSIHLDDDALEKLGLSKLPEVGTELALVAVVDVTSVSENDSGAGAVRSASLQITSMCLEAKKAAKSTVEKLYSKEA